MNKRRLMAGALGASLLASAVPGLALAQDEEPFAAEGVQWVLDTLSAEAIPEFVEVTLFLNGGEVVGNAGCNSYFGGYEIDAESLTFPEPFGSTQAICEEPVQAIEDAYLPLLQTTATWSVDDEGVLSLADADGNVALTYGEAAVDVTATDLDALTATLDDLQAQIDTATEAVATLTKAAESVDVNAFDKRVNTLEKDVTKLQNQAGEVNVPKQKKRIDANETAIAANTKAITNLSNQLDKLKDRVKALEASDKDQEKRIAALEEAVFEAAPLPE